MLTLERMEAEVREVEKLLLKIYAFNCLPRIIYEGGGRYRVDYIWQTNRAKEQFDLGQELLSELRRIFEEAERKHRAS